MKRPRWAGGAGRSPSGHPFIPGDGCDRGAKENREFSLLLADPHPSFVLFFFSGGILTSLLVGYSFVERIHMGFGFDGACVRMLTASLTGEQAVRPCEGKSQDLFPPCLQRAPWFLRETVLCGWVPSCVRSVCARLSSWHGVGVHKVLSE